MNPIKSPYKSFQFAKSNIGGVDSAGLYGKIAKVAPIVDTTINNNTVEADVPTDAQIQEKYTGASVKSNRAARRARIAARKNK